MRRKGLNIDSLRGGGRSELADAVGVSPSTVNRWLAGKNAPDVDKYELIAAFLDTQEREPADAAIDLLTEIGIISPQLANEHRNPAVRSSPMTPSELADEAGIRDPMERHLFEVFLRGLTRTPQTPSGQGEDGGETAERQRG
ncbi:helix-turn-helix domain-containing protein [Streptacidiphilus sp. EB129]|uniref:helix-turn-helix domain-containing protein n=1 Tax=Streptacidiphilus sp. EB129 TaxID=3156262 RepID=UPI003518913A